MAEESSLDRIASLLEREFAVQLYLRGASQDTIARVVHKSKSWVNDLLRGVPKATR